jgi:hypothetical protein
MNDIWNGRSLQSRISMLCGADGERQKYDYRINLGHIPCHYGGSRVWFLCPARGCARRVATPMQRI